MSVDLPDIGKPPTLPELEKADVLQIVGVKYRSFGTHLLNDATGRKVDIIVHDMQKAEDITRKILADWIAGKGKPWTRETLISTLKDSSIADLTHLLIDIPAATQ